MDIKDLPCKSNLEFKEISVDSPNKTIAAILQNLYSSCYSETQAILQYVYQSYLTGGKEKDISDLLLKIAMVEMDHHKHLAEAIIAYGGNPYYTNSQNMPFRISCVLSNRNLVVMLEQDIKGEKMAVEGYENAILKIENESVKNMLKKIQEDEKVHVTTLETVLEYIRFYK